MIPMSKQLDFWKGVWGTTYTIENTLDITGLTEAWRDILGDRKISSVLEIGSNIGMNLAAIHNIHPEAELVAVEPVTYAIEQGKKLYSFISFHQNNGGSVSMGRKYDLTIAAGVLMHTAPEELDQFIDNLFSHSNKYVIIAELMGSGYVAGYHSGMDYVFARDYQKIIKEKYGLDPIQSGRFYEPCDTDYLLYENPVHQD